MHINGGTGGYRLKPYYDYFEANVNNTLYKNAPGFDDKVYGGNDVYKLEIG